MSNLNHFLQSKATVELRHTILLLDMLSAIAALQLQSPILQICPGQWQKCHVFLSSPEDKKILAGFTVLVAVQVKSFQDFYVEIFTTFVNPTAATLVLHQEQIKAVLFPVQCCISRQGRLLVLSCHTRDISAIFNSKKTPRIIPPYFLCLKAHVVTHIQLKISFVYHFKANKAIFSPTIFQFSLLHTTCWCIFSTICSFVISFPLSNQVSGGQKSFYVENLDYFFLGNFITYAKK